METTEETVGRIAGLTETAREKLNEKMESAKRFASQTREKAAEMAAKTKDTAEKAIHERPFTSMLVMFGVGVALGLVIGLVSHKETVNG